MATEEVNKPPPYPEMIFGAIEALKEKEGSNKSSISNYMESTNGDLPAAHPNLLSYHLNKLKESGELIMVKNNYKRPDPNAPAKRGRGRPPKPKDDASAPAAAAVFAPARPRGRPKKDPNAPPAPKKAKPTKPTAAVPSKTGKPRGRPRKVKPQMAVVEAN